MRNLKFRAWDKEKKVWIEGAYGFHILGESMLIGGLFHDYSIPKLNDIEITQYTGLQDDKMKDIYEGDIVLLGNWNFAKVVWHAGAFRFQWDGVRNTTTRVQLVPDSGKCYSCRTSDKEILGNIYETPEMLKIGCWRDFQKIASPTY